MIKVGKFRITDFIQYDRKRVYNNMILTGFEVFIVVYVLLIYVFLVMKYDMISARLIIVSVIGCLIASGVTTYMMYQRYLANLTMFESDIKEIIKQLDDEKNKRMAK